jgi:hypothetical protein
MDDRPAPSPTRPEHPVRDALTVPARYGLRQCSGWVLGPGWLLITLLLPVPEGLSEPGWHTAGVAGLMAVLWISESIPLPVTALLPLVLFPLLGVSTITQSAAPFANPIIYLFLGGFIIALAMQRWHLHRRIALNLIGALGTRPPRIIAGRKWGLAEFRVFTTFTKPLVTSPFRNATYSRARPLPFGLFLSVSSTPRHEPNELLWGNGLHRGTSEVGGVSGDDVGGGDAFRQGDDHRVLEIGHR